MGAGARQLRYIRSLAELNHLSCWWIWWLFQEWLWMSYSAGLRISATRTPMVGTRCVFTSS